MSRSYRYPYALVAWHSTPVGIDIERVQILDRHSPRLFARPTERLDWVALHDPQADVSSLWSSKEALAKALGKPVSYDPRWLGAPMFWPEGRAGCWQSTNLRSQTATSPGSAGTSRSRLGLNRISDPGRATNRVRTPHRYFPLACVDTRSRLTFSHRAPPGMSAPSRPLARLPLSELRAHRALWVLLALDVHVVSAGPCHDPAGERGTHRNTALMVQARAKRQDDHALAGSARGPRLHAGGGRIRETMQMGESPAHH